MNKKQRKAARRAFTQARIATQNQWIEDAFCVATDDRKERDRLFAAASEVLHRARQIVPASAR